MKTPLWRRPQKSRGERIAGKSLSFLWTILALGATRLSLPLLLKSIINRKLKSQKDFHGSIENLELSILGGGMTVRGLHFVQLSEPGFGPVVAVDEIHLHVEWLKLFKGQIVASVHISNPRVLIQMPVKEESEGERRKEKPPETPAGSLQDSYDSLMQKVRSFPPIKITDIRINNAEVHVQHLPGQNGTDVKLEDLELIVRNIHNNDRVWSNPVANIEGMGRVLSSGHLVVTAKAYPLATKPMFQGQLQLQNLQLTDVRSFLRRYAGTDASSGFCDVYSEFSAINGRFRGYVKPVLENVHLEKAPEEPTGKRVQGVLTRVVASMLRNRQEGRVATRIDFDGPIDHPGISKWAAIKNSLKNAFGASMKLGLDGDIGFFDVVKEGEKSSRP